MFYSRDGWMVVMLGIFVMLFISSDEYLMHYLRFGTYFKLFAGSYLRMPPIGFMNEC